MKCTYREAEWRAALGLGSLVCILLSLIGWPDTETTADILCWALLLRAVIHTWPSYRQRWNHAGWVVLAVLVVYTAALLEPSLAGPLALTCLWHEREDYHWGVDRVRRQFREAVDWRCPYREWYLRWNAFKYGGLCLVMLASSPLQYVPGGFVKVVTAACAALTLIGWKWKWSKGAVAWGLAACVTAVGLWEMVLGPATLTALSPFAALLVMLEIQREERGHQQLMQAFAAGPEETINRIRTNPLLLEESRTTPSVVMQYGLNSSASEKR